MRRQYFALFLAAFVGCNSEIVFENVVEWLICMLPKTTVCMSFSVSLSIFVYVCSGSDIKGDSEEGDM